MRPLLIVALLAAGCTSAPPALTPTPSPSPTAASPTPTITPAISPSASVTPSEGTGACPPDWTREAGGCATRFSADLDGDGKKETLSLVVPYPLEQTGPPRDWRVTGTLSSGAAVDVPLTPDMELVPEVIEAVDMNGDEREELVAEVHRGASTPFLGVFAFAPPRGASSVARFDAVQLAGEPLWIGYGGTVAHGDGGECVRAAGGVKLILRAIAVTGGGAAASQYHWIELTHRWEGTTLAFESAREGDASIPVDANWPGDYGRFWRFECFGVRVG